MNKAQKMKLKHRLQKRIQGAIDRGSTKIEELHLKIVGMPFRTLEQFARGPAKKANDFSQRRIGAIYASIRGFNQKVGHWTVDLLNRGDNVATAATDNSRRTMKARAAAQNGHSNTREATRPTA